MLTFSEHATAQPRVEIRTITPAHQTADRQTAIREGELCWTRYQDLAEIDRVAVGDLLEPGDLLTAGPCPSSRGRDDTERVLWVELACGDDTRMIFEGNFEVLIVDSGEACAMDLRNGTVDTLTDEPVQITAGGVTIGVEGTHFVVERPAASRYPTAEIRCVLFEGRVRIDRQSLGGTGAQAPLAELVPGETWSRSVHPFRGPVDRLDPTSAADRLAAAARNAGIDAARAYALGRLPSTADCQVCAAAERLEPLFEAVLAEPEAVNQRVDLAQALVEIGLPDRARFELGRVGLVTEEAMRSHGFDLVSDPPQPPSATQRPTPPRPPATAGRSPEPPLQTVRLATPIGYVNVLLPRDLRGGETISGTFERFPAGANKEKNRKRLDTYQIALGQSILPAIQTAWSLQLPQNLGQTLDVVLQNHRGRPQAQAEIQVASSEQPAAEDEFQVPSICRAGRPVTLSGPFDGDRQTTTLSLAGLELPILAETARAAIFACPESGADHRNLTVREAGTAVDLPAPAAIQLEVEITPPKISRGQQAEIVVRLTGLDRPVGVRIRNRRPTLVRLEGGDEQLLRFSPDSLNAERVASHTLRAKGLQRGTIQFTASLVELPMEP